MLSARILVIVSAIMGTGTQPAAAGAELSLSITADATETYLAEPLTICVKLTNISDHDVKVPVTWEEAGYFSGTITRPGKSKSWSFVTWAEWILGVRVITLRPGESYQRYKSLLEATDRQRPGTYVLGGKFESSGFAPDRVNDKKVPCWKGSISAKPLKIKVKEPPRKEDMEALEILCAPYGGVERPSRFGPIWGVGLRSDARYQTVLDKYPQSVYAPYCRLSMALHYLARYDGVGDGYKKGVEYVEGLLKMRPAFRLADRAELTLARLHLREAEFSFGTTPAERNALREKAVSHLEHVSLKHPTRPVAEEAKRLLKSLRTRTSRTQPANAAGKATE